MADRPVLLIADDDDDVVRLLRLFLRPLDCEILTARDGEEALAVAQERLPDVVLLDVMMPKRSGWEVCQTLKAMQRTADIAVVLSTARGDVKDRLTGLQLGADDYLVKPFNRDEVVKRIGTLLGRRCRSGAATACVSASRASSRARSASSSVRSASSTAPPSAWSGRSTRGCRWRPTPCGTRSSSASGSSSASCATSSAENGSPRCSSP